MLIGRFVIDRILKSKVTGKFNNYINNKSLKGNVQGN